MHQVILLPAAKQDIREAATWYHSQQNGLGKRFTNEVRTRVQLIRNNPKAFTIRYDDVRTAVLDVVPFMIHYTIEEEKRLIVVSAVMHTTRDPGLWDIRKR